MFDGRAKASLYFASFGGRGLGNGTVIPADLRAFSASGICETQLLHSEG